MLNLLITLKVIAWSLLFVIPGIVAAYRYSMATYIMAENPGMQATEAIERSKALMDGRKGDLFCLDLSFIGWAAGHADRRHRLSLAHAVYDRVARRVLPQPAAQHGRPCPQRLAAEPWPAAGRRLVQPELNTKTYPRQHGCRGYLYLQTK